jgi:hypothetical protein
MAVAATVIAPPFLVSLFNGEQAEVDDGVFPLSPMFLGIRFIGGAA